MFLDFCWALCSRRGPRQFMQTFTCQSLKLCWCDLEIKISRQGLFLLCKSLHLFTSLEIQCSTRLCCGERTLKVSAKVRRKQVSLWDWTFGGYAFVGTKVQRQVQRCTFMKTNFLELIIKGRNGKGICFHEYCAGPCVSIYSTTNGSSHWPQSPEFWGRLLNCYIALAPECSCMPLYIYGVINIVWTNEHFHIEIAYEICSETSTVLPICTLLAYAIWWTPQDLVHFYHAKGLLLALQS